MFSKKSEERRLSRIFDQLGDEPMDITTKVQNFEMIRAAHLYMAMLDDSNEKIRNQVDDALAASAPRPFFESDNGNEILTITLNPVVCFASAVALLTIRRHAVSPTGSVITTTMNAEQTLAAIEAAAASLIIFLEDRSPLSKKYLSEMVTK